MLRECHYTDPESGQLSTPRFISSMSNRLHHSLIVTLTPLLYLLSFSTPIPYKSQQCRGFGYTSQRPLSLPPRSPPRTSTHGGPASCHTSDAAKLASVNDCGRRKNCHSTSATADGADHCASQCNTASASTTHAIESSKNHTSDVL